MKFQFNQVKSFVQNYFPSTAIVDSSAYNNSGFNLHYTDGEYTN